VSGSVCDVELQVIGLDVEEFGALGGVGAGQVGCGHTGKLSMRGRRSGRALHCGSPPVHGNNPETIRI
jgi:hypothetical protein